MLKKAKKSNLCEIKKGDIVTRKSYGKDILFIVKKIIKTSENDIAILKGCTLRIEASSPISDLSIVEKEEFQKALNYMEYRINSRIKEFKSKNDKRKITIEQKKIVYTGKILHIDGESNLSNRLELLLSS